MKIRLVAKQATCLFLILTSMLLGLSFIRSTRAGMTVFSMNPVTGNVGTNVTLTANLTTANGGYNVTFDGVVVQAFGNATGNNVTASFLIPETFSGNHNVTVVDVKTGDNTTAVFSVTTAYLMNVTVPQAPKELQEGDSVPISVSITGGNASTVYNATVTVRSPAGKSYNEQLNILTSTLGSSIATLVYPDNFGNATSGNPGNFSGPNTNYIGNYTVSLDLSTSTNAFSVGLTNSTEYHRGQTVDIKAVYAQNENVTLTMSGMNASAPVNLTASSAGLIHYSSWTVPANALAGANYSISIVSISGLTVKTPADTQNFTVPGFAFNVTARNLAEETVQGVDIRAFENGTSVNNQTTNSQGLAVLMLEIGNYTLQGYFESVEVGESPSPYLVTNTTAVDFVCNLTNLDIRVIAVVSGATVGVPEVTVYLTPGGMTLTTDITGNAVAHSLLPNSAYNLTASRYNQPFNATPTPIPNLLVNGNPEPVYNFTITSPSFALKVDTFKADGQPFGNAVVEIMELVGGIHYNGTTDTNGTVTFSNAVFGRYDVVIEDTTGQQFNSTTVDLFQNQNVTLYCSLYGLSISVKLTDYFGQPFSNTNVTLQGSGSGSVSKRTGADGMATFDNLVGDSFTISVQLSDNGSPTAVESLIVGGSTTVPITINKYVLLAGFPVETNQLAIAIIIVLTLLLILSLEIYRRRRSKSKETDS